MGDRLLKLRQVLIRWNISLGIFIWRSVLLVFVW